jgi:hypothetical protein
VRRGLVAFVGASVALGAAALASGASAATLVGDYQFQGTRASAGSGPAVTDVNGTSTFQPDTVMGASRQVLAFPEHSGVQMIPSVGTGSVPYSVVTTFRLENVSDSSASSYRRILDPSNQTQDAGFYVYQGMADYYGDTIDEVISPTVDFADNVYATVAITSLPPTASLIYVNGRQVVSAPETLPVVADTLRFFKDDSNGDEESGGAVSCIRVYSGALTDAEVAAIGASPTCSAPPPVQPVAKKKKCKKHKKKHRAAEAKKKKCKKKKKR